MKRLFSLGIVCFLIFAFSTFSPAAVTLLNKAGINPSHWSGLSTDTKPTTGSVGSTFYEENSSVPYMYGTTGWVVDARRGLGGATRADGSAPQVGDVLTKAALRWVAAPSAASGGDVSGPAASTDGELPIFSGVGGKTLKRSNTLTGIPKLTAGVLSITSTASDFPVWSWTANIPLANVPTAKATPLDADGIVYGDSNAGWAWKSITWANIKSFLKTYFDTLYTTPASLETRLGGASAPTATELSYVDFTAPAQGQITNLSNASATGANPGHRHYDAVDAAGTVDAITAAFLPAITVLSDGLEVIVRASGANATTTPTFTPNSGVVAAKTIVKLSNTALVAADIPGADFPMHLKYDSSLDKWVLLNAAKVPNANVVGLGGAALLAVGTTAGTVAAGDDARFKYTLLFGHQSFSPVDAYTYYIGNTYGGGLAGNNLKNTRKVYVPKTGTITTAIITTTATVGTAEASTLSFVINDTTTVQISAAVTFDATSSYTVVTGFTQAVTAGDFMEIKWACPTWATNPTWLTVCVNLVIE